MELTKEKAKDLAILKWQHIVDNNGSNIYLTKTYPIFLEFIGLCPYCQLYINSESKYNLYCKKCPIKISNILYDDIENNSCSQKLHPYSIWLKNKTKENAQKVLDLIINS